MGTHAGCCGPITSCLPVLLLCQMCRLLLTWPVTGEISHQMHQQTAFLAVGKPESAPLQSRDISVREQHIDCSSRLCRVP